MSSDIEKLPVKLSLPLEYQQDLFHELQAEDELVVLARGLGLLRVVTNLLHAYDAAGNNLIIIVGADDRENGWIGEALAEQAAISNAPLARGLTLVNTDVMSVGTRERLYSQGGIFSITSQILVVDLLTTLLDPKTVSGMIVLHGERVIATSTEAFILRLYRQNNKDGFLKAFSDNAEPFTGFAPLSTTMRNLFLRKPSLWPRFHITVAQSLEGTKKAEVIELEVPMTDNMRDIQNAILECVEASIGDLKKGNSGLEMDDWNLDSALHKNFDTVIRRQLDPVWHRTSWKTRMIVHDLTILRQLLHSLLTYDAVGFHQYLDTIRAAHSPPPGSTRQNQSPWLFLDAAHTIFDCSKKRVYAGRINYASDQAISDSLSPVLEELPKWSQLSDILDEIERDAYLHPVRDDSNGTILVMCTDGKTCRQLREYLQTRHIPDDEKDQEKPSALFMMRRKLRTYLSWKKNFSKVSAALFEENQKAISGIETKAKGKAPPNKRRRARGGASTGSSRMNGVITIADDNASHIQDLVAEIQPNELEAQQKFEIATDPLEDMDEFFELYEMNDLVLIHPFDGDLDEHILEEVKPRYIVMYEPDAAFIRRIEVYRSSHTDRNVRVYFLYYGGSVEEQRYLSAVRKEKDAFTRLIREKSNMALTLTTDARFSDPQESFLRTVNTRIAGGGRLAATAEPPRVVVDVRELRSPLPSLLHGSSVVVVPCLLTVGDYILTPDICIERKSVKDLVSSFKDGRLYTQAETMLQHYKSPMLLIEFDVGKSFTLEPFTDFNNANAANPTDLQSKLVLLTLAFPRLKIIWSSSPYETAKIFQSLKTQSPEPDPIKAVQVGLDGQESDVWSQEPMDMLRSANGVTAKNIQRLLFQAENILALANQEKKDLEQLMGKEAGQQIWRFFTRNVFGE